MPKARKYIFSFYSVDNKTITKALPYKCLEPSSLQPRGLHDSQYDNTT